VESVAPAGANLDVAFAFRWLLVENPRWTVAVADQVDAPVAENECLRGYVAVADHVAVSTKELREISRAVAKLKARFDHARDLVDSYDTEIGSGDVAGALDDFADDWNKKREQLCDGLEFLGRTAGTAAKAYDGLDQHLAQALLKSQPESGGK
jgi:uncharacterized protein YukE